jgi:hypothetical protein
VSDLRYLWLSGGYLPSIHPDKKGAPNLSPEPSDCLSRCKK